jgi:small-conductance mechanosensitive channel
MLSTAATFGAGLLMLAAAKWIGVLLCLHFGHREIDYLVAAGLIETAATILSIVFFTFLVRRSNARYSKHKDRVSKSGITAFACSLWDNMFITYLMYPRRRQPIDSVPLDQFVLYYGALAIVVVLLSYALGLWARSKNIPSSDG